MKLNPTMKNNPNDKKDETPDIDYFKKRRFTPEQVKVGEEKSQELIEKLDRRLNTKREKKSLFKKTKEGVTTGEKTFGNKNLIKGIIIVAVLIVLGFSAVLIFNAQRGLKPSAFLKDNVAATIYEDTGNGGHYITPDQSNLTLGDFTDKKATANNTAFFKELGFEVYANTKVYSMSFKVKPTSTGYFGFRIFMIDGIGLYDENNNLRQPTQIYSGGGEVVAGVESTLTATFKKVAFTNTNSFNTSHFIFKLADEDDEEPSNNGNTLNYQPYSFYGLNFKK
jgi:hypothetical protein